MENSSLQIFQAPSFFIRVSTLNLENLPLVNAYCVVETKIWFIVAGFVNTADHQAKEDSVVTDIVDISPSIALDGMHLLFVQSEVVYVPDWVALAKGISKI